MNQSQAFHLILTGFFISYKVIDSETLIEPALEQVLEDAVMEAKDKAMEETMSRLTAVQAAVQATQGILYSTDSHMIESSCMIESTLVQNSQY